MDHVKKYLTEASEKELDNLTKFLAKRKKKTRPDERRPSRLPRPGASRHTEPKKSRTLPLRTRLIHEEPEVKRSITAQDLAEAEAVLYPEKDHGTRPRKRKLCER